MHGMEQKKTGYGMKGQEHLGFDSAAGNLRGTMADTGDMENQQADMQVAAATPVPQSIYAGNMPAPVPWLKFTQG